MKNEKYHQIDLYLYLNDESKVETKTSLEEVKEFINIINNMIEESKNSDVVLELESVTAEVFSVTFNYCRLFDNINIHYVLNGKEVDCDDMFIYLNSGYDYIINYIDSIYDEFKNNNNIPEGMSEINLLKWE